MKITNNSAGMYTGGDDATGQLVHIHAGETVEVSDQMGERLLATFPDQFVQGEAVKAEAPAEEAEDGQADDAAEEEADAGAAAEGHKGRRGK
jgi:hypothetical protein